MSWSHTGFLCPSPPFFPRKMLLECWTLSIAVRVVVVVAVLGVNMKTFSVVLDKIHADRRAGHTACGELCV